MPAHLLITIEVPAAVRAESSDSPPPSPQTRETVIRDVNHRINNNLQDLIALMRLQATQRMSAQEVIDQSVARLVAVSTAFALASRHGASIPLRDLVAGIARNAEQASWRRIPLQLSAAATRNAVLLPEQHAANMALVINELVCNAIRHASQDEASREVRIFIDRDGDSAQLRIVSGIDPLSAGIPLEAQLEPGMEPGLAKLLLPRDGCTLSMTGGAGGVCAQLVLRQTMLSDAHGYLP
jgi:two-component sensor histidine kinase